MGRFRGDALDGHGKVLKGNACGEVTEGKCPAGKGKVAAHNSYSAAIFIYPVSMHALIDESSA